MATRSVSPAPSYSLLMVQRHGLLLFNYYIKALRADLAPRCGLPISARIPACANVIEYVPVGFPPVMGSSLNPS